MIQRHKASQKLHISHSHSTTHEKVVGLWLVVISGLHAEIAGHIKKFSRSSMPRMTLLIPEMDDVPQSKSETKNHV